MSEWNAQQKPASAETREIHRRFAERFGLDLTHTDNAEYALAKQHCILPLENYTVRDAQGGVVFDTADYAFLRQDAAADTVHPSLWLNGKSNALAGVFEVVPDKIYQVRGLDIANLTVIRSKTGWIVLDATSFPEVAAASLELLEQALGEPVRDRIRAVIVSHSHGDHFGGVAGVVSEEQTGDPAEGKIPVIVPAGFDEETVKENVFAGHAMGWRARYQFGFGLTPGAQGKVSAGIGVPGGRGSSAYVRPTDFIEEDTTRIIDGLEVVFQLTPGTEAPAEMNNYFPEYRAFWAAENCSGTLHNLYPIRGAQLRDSAAWWRFTIEALERYGKQSDVVFQAHNWPHYNTPEQPHGVEDYLRNTAAIYKHIHDRTLLYASLGKTAKETAKLISIPEGLERNWYTRPYYGSPEINSRAVYTKYLGFWNANPNEINPLTEPEEAALFVEYAGSAERVLELAERDFAAGRYDKAAKAAGYVVYTDPQNLKARYLQADAFEQLGYQAESSVWRNAYLSGAKELREPEQNGSAIRSRNSIIVKLSPRLLLDYLGIVTDGEKLADADERIRIHIVDPAQPGDAPYHGRSVGTTAEFVLHVYHGTLLYYEGHTEEALPYLSVTERDLPLLAIPGETEFFDRADTNAPEILHRIRDAVTDIAAKSQFPMFTANTVTL